jgi:hypothetical protein
MARRRKNKNNQQQQPQRRVVVQENITVTRRSSRRRRNRGMGGAQTAESVALAKSLANPWEFSACVPDGSYGTGCFSTRAVSTLATGVGGTCNAVGLTVYPQGQYYIDTAHTTAVPFIDGDWSATPQITSIANLYGKFRPVSAGIKGMYIGPTVSDGGVVLCGIVSGQVPLSNFNGLGLLAAQALMMKYKTYPLRESWKVTWRPNDYDDMCQFKQLQNAPVDTGSLFEEPYLIAIVYGAASNQATIHVELVVNYEGQFESQTFMPGGLDSASRHAEPGWYERVKNMISGVEQISNLIPQAASALGSVAAAAPYLSNGMRRFRQLGASGMPRNLLLQ